MIDNEYLVRAKKTNSKEWVYGYRADIGGVCVVDKYGEIHDVDANTVCRYLQETFKGNKIFEGDMFEWTGSAITGQHKEWRNKTGIASFNWSLGVHMKPSGNLKSAISSCDCKLIGNIFDDKEIAKYIGLIK